MEEITVFESLLKDGMDPHIPTYLRRYNIKPGITPTGKLPIATLRQFKSVLQDQMEEALDETKTYDDFRYELTCLPEELIRFHRGWIEYRRSVYNCPESNMIEAGKRMDNYFNVMTSEIVSGFENKELISVDIVEEDNTNNIDKLNIIITLSFPDINLNITHGIKPKLLPFNIPYGEIKIQIKWDVYQLLKDVVANVRLRDTLKTNNLKQIPFKPIITGYHEATSYGYHIEHPFINDTAVCFGDFASMMDTLIETWNYSDAYDIMRNWLSNYSLVKTVPLWKPSAWFVGVPEHTGEMGIALHDYTQVHTFHSFCSIRGGIPNDVCDEMECQIKEQCNYYRKETDE